MQYWCGKMVNGSTSRISTETKRIHSEDLEPQNQLLHKWIHFFKNYNGFVVKNITCLFKTFMRVLKALHLLKSGKTCRDGYHTTFHYPQSQQKCELWWLKYLTTLFEIFMSKMLFTFFSSYVYQQRLHQKYGLLSISPLLYGTGIGSNYFAFSF